ncbi:MAG: cobaltochelatase subunit CobN, partial [Alphaproteobacteria bacterium]|nr:cobaltochelatase subunit CobN [Alphaproteobacteria bacterium]
MHFIAAHPGAIDDGSHAIDLAQTPGDIVVLTAADTELSLLARACGKLEDDGLPSLRLASILHLGHNMSVDFYVDTVIRHAKLVVVRLLGGRGYWPYGVDEILRTCREENIPVAFLPGDDQPDAELVGLSSVPAEAHHRLWQYAVHGGPDNAIDFLRYASSLCGFETPWREPRPLVRAGLYWPGRETPDLATVKAEWRDGLPVAAVVFYRALVQAGNLKVIDAMVDGLRGAGLNPLPVFAASLKDPVAAAMIGEIFEKAPPDVILNATGFSVSAPGSDRKASPFDLGTSDRPGPVVLQAVFSGGNEADWRDGTRGLGARDIAMNVALPEVDGRVFSRAVSFKSARQRDLLSETDIVEYEPVTDRVHFVCEMASRWAGLRRKAPETRRIALILANYPNRDGRIGNGVGLDTPAGAVKVLEALEDNGYRVGDIPEDGDALVARMMAGPTNDFAKLATRNVTETLSMADYQIFLGDLPKALQEAVHKRWGAPEADHFFRPGEVDCGHFAISAFRLGNIAVCLQPARGYNIDPKATYHDPDLVPPHNYLAFYAWVRREFMADAVCHLGKHGNLEWLPGKALALSEECWPEAALGALPNLYPFIVNDPGEGTQAKRRTGAVIIDHLTPPLTRAESYGPLSELEQLVDEYYEASGVDPRRVKVLSHDILELCAITGIDRDCAIGDDDDEDSSLSKLDNYLCELKEMQIRDGLHVFGASPEGRLLDDLLVAL